MLTKSEILFCAAQAAPYNSGNILFVLKLICFSLIPSITYISIRPISHKHNRHIYSWVDINGRS
jgi:hypothetical protein